MRHSTAVRTTVTAVVVAVAASCCIVSFLSFLNDVRLFVFRFFSLFHRNYQFGESLNHNNNHSIYYVQAHIDLLHFGHVCMQFCSFEIHKNNSNATGIDSS